MLSLRLALALASLLHVVISYDLSDWLAEANDSLLSNRELSTFVPEPYVLTDTYAYDRFGLWSGLKRIVLGTSTVESSRPVEVDQAIIDGLDDKYKQGLVYFWALGGTPRNLTAAVEAFEAAAQDGDPDAMFMVGVAYSTGLLGAVPQDQAKATLYYTFGAEAGSLESRIAMGHRIMHGIHSVKDYDRALYYYSLAGDDLLDTLRSYHTPLRIDSESNGVEGTFYTKTPRSAWTFGAESGTGLYGRHMYLQFVQPNLRMFLPLGEQSTAWHFVNSWMKSEFDNIDEAVQVLYDRALEENDVAAQYTLALIYAAGIGTGPPNWRHARTFAEMCANPAPDLSFGLLQPQIISAMCTEFLAERYLHGGEGLRGNHLEARKLYKQASSVYERLQQKNVWPSRSTCLSSLALLDWLAAGKPRTNSSAVMLHEAMNVSSLSNDYTVAIELAELWLELGNRRAALEALRKAARDTKDRAPVASLMLAQLETHEKRLYRYVGGILAADSYITPMMFGHFSYERGDLESAALAFLVSAELGVPAAPLNLADLLDTHHSQVGTSRLAQYFPRLRALSEWPIPSFIDSSRRTWFAFKYFALAAAEDSVDALTKTFEYGKMYGYVTKDELLVYLRMLSRLNFGWAHWLIGRLLGEEDNLSGAMDEFTRALSTPEAWLPVKFSQVLTGFRRILAGAPRRARQTVTRFPGLRTALEAYWSLTAIDIETDGINEAAMTAAATAEADIKWVEINTIVILGIVLFILVLFAVVRFGVAIWNWANRRFLLRVQRNDAH